jgi:hypothetical protein
MFPMQYMSNLCGVIRIVACTCVNSDPRGIVACACASSDPRGIVACTFVSSYPRGIVACACARSDPRGIVACACVNSDPPVDVNPNNFTVALSVVGRTKIEPNSSG